MELFGLEFKPEMLLILGLLVCSLLWSAYRMTKVAAYYGKNPVVWFCVTFFLTALPGTIYFWHQQRGQLQATATRPSEPDPRRCRHCGEILLDTSDHCPACNLPLDEGRLT